MGNVLLNRMIAWSLLITAGLAAVAGSKPIFDLYAKLWWYDEVVHFFFFFSITLVLSLHAYGALLTGRRRHEILLVLTIAGLGLALGTIWEMIEWAYDLGTPGNSIQGKWDTMIDLSVDFGGSALSGILSVMMMNKSRSPRLD
jgi:hypothetical protein